MQTLGREATATWIVCRGSLRAITSGLVACPAGRTTPIEECLECRSLEDVEEDRDLARSCTTDAAADLAPESAWDDVPSTSCDLAIELL